MKTPRAKSRWAWLWWPLPLPPILWLAAILAQSWQPNIGLGGLLVNLTTSLENPLALRWTVLIFSKNEGEEREKKRDK